MRRIVVALVAALLMTSLVACGSKPKTDSAGVAYSATHCPTANAERLGGIKIAADLGIMYVAFDKFIYQPFKANHLSGIKAKAEAGAAALALFHFAKKVRDHVIYSSSLCSKIGGPVSALVTKLGNLPTLVRDAVAGGSSIEAIKTGMNSLPGLAKGAGLPTLDLANGVSSVKDLAGIK